MPGDAAARYTAFLGHRRIGAGSLPEIARLAAALRSDATASHDAVLIFDDRNGQQVDLDERPAPEIPASASASMPASPAPAAGSPTPRPPGRPKLGVVAREVTLLPRHWEWLATQPGGASVALRKLVDEARHRHGAQDRIRASQERCYRFATALAGNLPAYEAALRALFALDGAAFEASTAQWPEDVREYARELAREAFIQGTATEGPRQTAA
ncbi:MAG: DUF2239 family protein [Burkholderiales bacterium]|nr:DUF2239 family protein [Burkholderiales bacterium]